MKVSDLMIGDFVKDGDIVIKIKGDDYFISSNLRNLSPILITDMILKANGFLKQGKYWMNTFGFPFVITKDKDEYDLSVLSWSGTDDIVIFSIKYVHELQHILKICKVEKDFVIL